MHERQVKRQTLNAPSNMYIAIVWYSVYIQMINIYLGPLCSSSCVVPAADDFPQTFRMDVSHNHGTCSYGTWTNSRQHTYCTRPCFTIALCVRVSFSFSYECVYTWRPRRVTSIFRWLQFFCSVVSMDKIWFNWMRRLAKWKKNFCSLFLQTMIIW